MPIVDDDPLAQRWAAFRTTTCACGEPIGETECPGFCSITCGAAATGGRQPHTEASAKQRTGGMTFSEFSAAVARDEASGGRKGSCGHSLGPRFDGEHPMLNGKEVCQGCYDSAMSDEIDEHPIGRPRPRGGAVAGG